MVSVNNKGYNLGEVTVSNTLVVGASTTIGSASEINSLKEFADFGVMRIIANIEMNDQTIAFNGCVVCNNCSNGFEFHTVTYFDDQVTGGSPIIIGGQVYVDGSYTKVHLTAVVVE